MNMPFKPGESGNKRGRAKGSQNKRTQLAKLMEPYAEQLVAKAIELGLGGDVTALRLCIERLIPKIKREPIGVELPQDINEKNIPKLKFEVLHAVLEGRMSVDEAEKLIKLINDGYQEHSSSLMIPELSRDPLQAVMTYRRIMMES